MLLPEWLAGLLPIATAVLAVLLLLSTIAAIRALRPPAPAVPQAAAAPAGTPPVASPVGGNQRGAFARLQALTGSRRGIEAVPLLVAIGAGITEVQRLIGDPGDGSSDPSHAQHALFRGDCRIAVCQDGAVVSFEDGLLGSDRWEPRWTALMNELLRVRGDRPFDGLVIVRPVSQLYGPTRLADDALVVLGEQIYQLIWMAQRAAGWRVPIYLVLSRSEALTGFTATCGALRALGSEVQAAPFGWAVPFALASAFERRWVSEGIDALVSRLSFLQSRLLMRTQDTETAELVLLFPQAVAAIGEPLATLLTPMLRPSAYHEPFMFRGFYLTGRPEGAAASLPDAFAARLFADRIFPEQVLAQPALGAMTRRQRRVRIAQAALAVLLLVALIGVLKVRGLGSAASTVAPLVTEIAILGDHFQAAQDVVPGVRAAAEDLGLTQQISIAETQRLLLLMSGVSLNQLETWWAPLSYVTNGDAVLQRAIRAAYQVAVLREVRRGLTTRIPSLLGVSELATGARPDPAAEVTCETSSATSGDTARLQQLTQQLNLYARQLQAYQGLTENPHIDTLQSLVEYALSIQLPSGFTSNNRLYVAALEGAVAPPLQIGPIRNTVGSILRPRFARALYAAYPASPLGVAVDAVVVNADGASTAAPFTRLGALAGAMHTVQAQAPLPDNAWLHDISAPSISGALNQLGALSVSGPGNDLAPVDTRLPTVLRQEAADCLGRTRQRLLGARVFDAVPVLTATGDTFRLSPPLLSVLPALDAFLAQPLVSAKVAPVIAPTGPNPGPLFWDVADLTSLQDLAEAYLVFTAQNLPATLPAAFRDQVQAAAGAQLDLLAVNAIGRAQQRGLDRRAVGLSGAAGVLRDEIGRFADAAPVMTNLRTALRNAGRTSSAERLDQLLSDQAVRLLGQVDRLLAAADPYQLADRSLAFWSGQPPLAAAAFGAATLPDLVATLPARRDYVEALARDHAAPLVTYLQQSDVVFSAAGMTLLKRWQGVVDTLDRYHRADPANSLSRLEQFIASDMDRIDLANCLQLTAGAGGGADWFAAQLANIRMAVAERCGGATYGDSVAQYADLAGTFNRDLAGRFPFGPPTGPDADPADVKRFFNRFGADLAALQPRLAGIGAYARAGAARFVGQLQAVQAALAPMLTDPAPDAPLSYNAAVEFRTNIGSDPGANQVLEETVQFGQLPLSSFAATRSLTWSNGQTVQVLLHWAENAPRIPAGGGDQPAPAAGGGDQPAQVRGLVASYQYGGAWALLRMIAAQRPNADVLAQLSDRRPETLGFSVNLQPNPNAASGGDAALTAARLFMRFALTAILRTPGQPDKHQPVAMPLFPTAAPQPDVQPARFLR